MAERYTVGLDSQTTLKLGQIDDLTQRINNATGRISQVRYKVQSALDAINGVAPEKSVGAVGISETPTYLTAAIHQLEIAIDDLLSKAEIIN